MNTRSYACNYYSYIFFHDFIERQTRIISGTLLRNLKFPLTVASFSSSHKLSISRKKSHLKVTAYSLKSSGTFPYDRFLHLHVGDGTMKRIFYVNKLSARVDVWHKVATNRLWVDHCPNTNCFLTSDRSLYERGTTTDRLQYKDLY